MENEKITFTSRIGPLITPMLKIELLAAVIVFVALLVQEDMKFDIKMIQACGLMLTAVTPIMLSIAVVGIIVSKIIVEPHRVSARNPFSNKYESLDWDDITSIQLSGIFGYKYFVLCSDTKAVWVPVGINDQSNFIHIVKDKTNLMMPSFPNV